MKTKILPKIPFLITGISLFLPLPAAFFDNRLFVFLPMIIITLICLVVLNGRASIPKVLFFTTILVLLCSFLSWLLNGGAYLGLANVLLLMVMYLLLIQKYEKYLHPLLIVKYFTVIYTLVLIYLGFEWLFIFSGNQSWLVDTFRSESVTAYKNYNSATFVNFILDDSLFTGANGPTLGSQGASQLILAGSIFVIPWNKFMGRVRLGSVINSFIFGLFFLVNSTMTMSLGLAFILLYLIFLAKDSVLSHPVIKFAVIVMLFFFTDFALTSIFYRVGSKEDLEIYQEAFFRLSEFQSLNIFQSLIGAGSELRYSGSDFGWGGIVFSGGIISFIAFSFVLIYLIIQVRKCVALAIRSKKIMTDSDYCWTYLASANLLISFIFYFGLIHYTPSVELGCAQLFALSMAVGLHASSQVLNRLNSRITGTCEELNRKPDFLVYAQKS